MEVRDSFLVISLTFSSYISWLLKILRTLDLKKAVYKIKLGSLIKQSYLLVDPFTFGAIKAFKRGGGGVLYHGENCNRGPKNDPPILEPSLLLVNR